MELNSIVIPLKCTPFQLQRLYLAESLPLLEQVTGKHAVVDLSDGSTFICRICTKDLLKQDNCLLEKSVQCSLPNAEAALPVKLLKVNVIPQVKPLRNIKVTVVLRDIQDLLGWKNKSTSNLPLLRQLLQLFVVHSKCTVNLQNFVAAEKLGVLAIYVNDIGITTPGRVTPSTKVFLEEIVSSERFALRSTTSRVVVAGNHSAYEQLEKYVKSRAFLNGNSLARLNPQLIVVGPSGSGKKTLIRKIGQECGAVVIQVDCSRLMRPKPGDTEALIRQHFQRAQQLSEEGLVILLLLRLELICSKAGRLLNQMNEAMDSVARIPNLIIATTTSEPGSLHESVKTASRFNQEVFVGVPNEADRLEMLKLLGSDVIKLSHDKWNEVAKMTPGFVLADVALLMSKVERYISVDGVQNSEDTVFALLKNAFASIEPSAVRGELGLVKSNSPVQRLGGLNRIKEVLNQLVQWPLLHPEAFRRLNIKHSSGILLYGPPGCAKTSLTRSVAAENNVTFLAVSAADLYSPYVGDTERTISSLFRRARAAAPTLLFIDEIDALVGNRQGTQKKAQERVLSSFLIEMDGVGINPQIDFLPEQSESKIVIVAATNRPHVIDTALLRPGRLDKLILVPPPDIDDRMDILRVLTEGMPLDETVDLRDIAEKTELYSGADLANLCREASYHAMTSRSVDVETVSSEDFASALDFSHPSLSTSEVEWFKNFSFS